MSKLLKAADDVRSLVRTIQNVQDIADALESVGTLERNKSELEKQVKELGAQIADGTADLKKIRDQIKKQTEEAKAKFENEATVAASIHAQATDKARDEAAKIIAEASQKRDVILEEVKRLEDKAKATNEAIKTAEETLAGINANIEKVKAQAARLLGA